MALVQQVLGPDLVGAYLFGSAVLGGLRPDSDLDVLALSRRATTLGERQALVDRLLAISGRDGRRRVELTLVIEQDLRPWRFPPRFDFQYGDWLRADFERGDLDPWPSAENGDLATLLTMVRQFGETLVGPPAPELIPAVPEHDLRAAMLGDLDALRSELDTDTRNVLLTLARIWCTLATGEIRAKDDAAAWALQRLSPEHRPALAHARSGYLGEGHDRWDGLGDRVSSAADRMLGEIRRSAER